MPTTSCGSAAMRDPTTRDAAVEAAREEARSQLAFLHRLGVLDPGDDHMRPVARRLIMRAGLPDPVLDYVLRRLDEKPAAAREGGRPSNVSRDFWIVHVLGCLAVNHGLPLTRNRARKRKLERWIKRGAGDPRPHTRPSACAVVAQALGELGIGLDETGVETVWSKRRPRRSPREVKDEWQTPANVASPEDEARLAYEARLASRTRRPAPRRPRSVR